MKQHSLSRRLSTTIFGVIAVTVAVSMVAVEVFVNDVEDTIRGLELKLDAEYFTQQISEPTFQTRPGKRVALTFISCRRIRQSRCCQSIC